MGFDKDSNLPLVQPQKQTTKVNFSIVIGVLIFLALSAGVIVWLSNNPHEAVPAQEKKAS